MTAARSGFTFVPDLMDFRFEQAITRALRKLYRSKELKIAWPGAHDAKIAGRPISPAEIELIVVPLDRIGAPAGGSGARVFFAYFSHSAPAGRAYQASPPLVIKIGAAKQLQSEIKSTNRWPTLPEEIGAHFAKPIYLHTEDADNAVLIAPFRSEWQPEQGGRRNRLLVNDLWGLLHMKEELLAQDLQLSSVPDWARISRYIGWALETIDYAHRANRATYRRRDITYARHYRWYLRGTVSPGRGEPNRSHIPTLMFGDGRTVALFGRTWQNPNHVIRSVIERNRHFTGTVGPVHGDLHPKNIVLGGTDDVQIIDFGWARRELHVVVDYLLLDINLRGTTLPSQLSRADFLEMASFLDPDKDPSSLPPTIQQRATIIKEQIWDRLRNKGVVHDWHSEYLIPFFIVNYGLLVHLDAARSQPALIATLLYASEKIATARV